LTGKVVVDTLLSQVRANPNVKIAPFTFFRDLTVDGNRVTGILVEHDGQVAGYAAKATLLATGGGSQVYSQSTNPDTATGDGLAAAYRAGAELRDMEFVQFHPTVLSLRGAPRFLLTEALRGDGARIMNERGERFVNELLTRDEVSRAVFRELSARPEAKVYLDVTHLSPETLRKKFQHVYSTCLNYGLDITRDHIPITPAAHYFMGGVRTDLSGRASLKGLYLAGEVASTGVHGANRLASNSLLEALVFGRRTAEAMKEEKEIRLSAPQPAPSAVSSEPNQEVREITWRYAGIVRSAEGMRAGLKLLQRIPEESNLLTVARIIHECALAREESRGAHYREDFPAAAAMPLHSFVQKSRAVRLA
jgi:L-aspartate oxidase